MLLDTMGIMVVVFLLGILFLELFEGREILH
jgi:hypothetical protein